MNYDGKQFRPVTLTDNAEVSNDTLFVYKQEGRVVTSTYSGGSIVAGHLLGIVDDDGCIEMRYHQINDQQQLMTGTCFTTPELLPNGKIRLHEAWKWTSGDETSGRSILEEV